MMAASPNGNAFGVERRKRVNPNKSSPAKTKPPRRDLTLARGMNDNHDGPISVLVPHRRPGHDADDPGELHWRSFAKNRREPDGSAQPRPVRVARGRERHEYSALGASGVARAGVFRPRWPGAVSTAGDSRHDVRLVSALVLALSPRRRDICRGWSDPSQSPPHP